MDNDTDLSGDDAMSPDDMDVMLQHALRRRGGAILEDVPLLVESVSKTSDEHTPSSCEYLHEDGDSYTDLPVRSTESDDLHGPLRPMQFIKRKSVLQKSAHKTPLERFRTVANQVKHNLKWAKAFSESKQEEGKSFVVQDKDGNEQKLTFDVNAFKANVQTVSVLPAAAKIILRKNPWERTSEDLLYVLPFVVKLTCFEKYSMAIKHELPCIVYYESFEDGRVIVKQGYPGLSFYFILTGTVTAELTEVDKRTDEQHTQYVGQFQAGSSFGELSLLRGTKRAATIICKGDAEFLRLDKDDFDMVLRRSYQHEWETRMNALKLLGAFGDWSEDELRATNDRATLEKYPPNTVILSDIMHQPDNIYFIKHGECKIIRDVALIQTQLPFGRIKYSLPPSTAEHELQNSQKLIRKYLHISTMKRGDFFGVGEDLRKTYIISIGKVECILVSQVAFLRHERGKCLEPMRKKVSEHFPSTEDAFQSFLESKTWKAYKRGLVKELASKRHIPNSTTINDVPLIMRRDNII